MKIVIALACLVAFAAAVEETAQIDADLDGAENRYGGGGHRGGHGGGRGGGGHHGGGRGRYGRSLEEAQPIMDEVDIFGYADLNEQDLEAAEHHNGGYRGGSAGYGNSGGQGYRGSGSHGYGGQRGRRSVEENIEDLEAAEHHSGMNYGRPSGSYGSQHHSGGSSGYGHSGSSGHSGHGSQHHSGHGY